MQHLQIYQGLPVWRMTATLHGESSADLTNISQQAHSVSLKFFKLFVFRSD